MRTKTILTLLIMYLLFDQSTLARRYVDFGYAQPNDTLTRTLSLTFNEEACKQLVHIDFVFVDQSGNRIQNVIYLLNGFRVKEDFIRIEPQNTLPGEKYRYRISVIFGPEAAEGTFKGYFKMANATPGIEYLDKNGSIVPVSDLTIPVRWKFNIPWTVGDYLLKLIIPLLLAVFVLWFALLKKILFLKFDGGYLEFAGNYSGRIRLKGLRRAYIGGVTFKRQSVIDKIVVGEVSGIYPELPVNIEFYPYKSGGKIFCNYNHDKDTQIDPFITNLCDHDELTVTNPLLEKPFIVIYLNSKHPRID